MTMGEIEGIDGDMELVNGVDIDLYGDLGVIDKEELKNYIAAFFSKHSEEKDIYDLSVHIKEFNDTYLGKPLVFCSLSANTEYGVISINSNGWGIKQALRGGLNSLVIEVNKFVVKELYGERFRAI